MSFPDIVPELKAKMPELRGRLLANQSLGEFTWFRVGGPAQAFFMPEDENDLAYFMRNLPPEIPTVAIGAGSNLIVRDGGVPGVVIRLGRGFNDAKVEGDRVTAGNGDARRDGGARGADGRHCRIGISQRHSWNDRRRAAHERRRLWRRDQGRFCRSARRRPAGEHPYLQQWRHGLFLPPLRGARRRDIHLGGFQGRAGAPEEIAAEMAQIKKKREASQPRNRTGGSTFKNPPGHSAWKLIDDAGCRGLTIGGAQVSELHSNFLINLGGASAADIETLGETVRERVKAHSGVELEWEIKRVGVKA